MNLQLFQYALRRIAVFLALCAFNIFGFAQAGSLTPAQQQALKTYITGQSDLNSQPHTSDGAFAIAVALNLPSSPALQVFKSSVPLGDVGKAMLQADIANLTTANTSRLQVIAQFTSNGILVPTADMQSGFNSIFSVSGASGTRANLAALWQRTATRAEGVLATCPCTTSTPGTLNWEGLLTYQDVQTLMGW